MGRKGYARLKCTRAPSGTQPGQPGTGPLPGVGTLSGNGKVHTESGAGGGPEVRSTNPGNAAKVRTPPGAQTAIHVLCVHACPPKPSGPMSSHEAGANAAPPSTGAPVVASTRRRFSGWNCAGCTANWALVGSAGCPQRDTSTKSISRWPAPPSPPVLWGWGVNTWRDFCGGVCGEEVRVKTYPKLSSSQLRQKERGVCVGGGG
jgi:hypothetical protein